MNRAERELRLPERIEPVLERVITGRLSLAEAQSQLELSEYDLGVLIRALIRQRARDQEWFED